MMSVGMDCEGIWRALLDTAVRDARLYLRLVRHRDQRSSGVSICRRRRIARFSQAAIEAIVEAGGVQFHGRSSSSR